MRGLWGALRGHWDGGKGVRWNRVKIGLLLIKGFDKNKKNSFVGMDGSKYANYKGGCC